MEMNFDNVNVPNTTELYSLKRLKWPILFYLCFTAMKTAMNDILRTIRET